MGNAKPHGCGTAWRAVSYLPGLARSLLVLLLLSLLTACSQPAAPAAPTGNGEPAVEVASGDAPAAGAVENPAAGPAASSPTATPAPLTGRIVLWHSWAGTDGAALAEILAAFQQKNPDLIVDTLFVAYPDLAQGYVDAVASGSGPDLVLAPAAWLGDLVTLGAVQPLDGLVAPAAVADYWPGALEGVRWNGQLYGLPTYFDTVSLFANTSLVDPANPPQTTDALLAGAQAGANNGIGLYNNLFHLYWGIPAYGGQLFDADGLAVLDATPGPAAYLDWLKAVSKTPGSYVDTDYGMLLDRFKKGEFGYFVDGPWSIGELSAALGENLAVLPLPAGPAGPASPWLQTDGVFLNPKLTPEQQALALAFARHLTSAESGAALASTARRLPANRQVTIGADPLLEGFMQQAATAQALPNRPEMDGQTWGYGGDMFIKAVDGDADAAATVLETAALINEAHGR